MANSPGTTRVARTARKAAAVDHFGSQAGLVVADAAGGAGSAAGGATGAAEFVDTPEV